MNIKTNSPTLTSPTLTTSSGTSSTYTVTSITGNSGYYGVTGSFTGYSFISHTTLSKVKYNVLGKDIEVDGSYKDATTALYISMVNLQGKAFYDEVKKQGIEFPKEIEDYLKVALIPWERNKKLDTLL